MTINIICAIIQRLFRQNELSQIVLWTRMGDQALSVAGPRAWNALPAVIRRAPSLDSGEWTRTFKKHLKSHLFSAAYDI